MKILTTFLMLWAIVAHSQAPANDCGENAMVIDQCGSAFGITQSQMGNATEDENCSVGGSCPIIYVNGVGYENFDCDGSTGNTAGDDFNGSIENSVWWTFTPLESCNYDVYISITNCCCKDKGSSNSAQYQIFDADANLPGGTIQNIMASQSGVTGNYLETVSVTNSNPVYILIDGLNGTDCNISVTIQPTTSCTGCAIELPIELASFTGRYVNKRIELRWVSNLEINNSHYIIERSRDGRRWGSIATVPGAGNSSSELVYTYTDNEFPKLKYLYYRLVQVDFDGNSERFKTIAVYMPFLDDPMVVAHYDPTGRVINDLTKYNGLYVTLYEDGTRKKTYKVPFNKLND